MHMRRATSPDCDIRNVFRTRVNERSSATSVRKFTRTVRARANYRRCTRCIATGGAASEATSMSRGGRDPLMRARSFFRSHCADDRLRCSRSVSTDDGRAAKSGPRHSAACPPTARTRDLPRAPPILRPPAFLERRGARTERRAPSNGDCDARAGARGKATIQRAASTTTRASKPTIRYASTACLPYARLFRKQGRLEGISVRFTHSEALRASLVASIRKGFGMDAGSEFPYAVYADGSLVRFACDEGDDTCELHRRRPQLRKSARDLHLGPRLRRAWERSPAALIKPVLRNDFGLAASGSTSVLPRTGQSSEPEMVGGSAIEL